MDEALPNRKTFRANDIVAAVYIETDTYHCNGHYHYDCLTEYFTINNTCPLHDEIVLFEFDSEPQFVPGSRVNNDTLDQIGDHIEAAKFVIQLWNATKSLQNNEQIYESNLEEKINETLAFIAERYNHEQGLVIKKEHWDSVMDAAREMVRMHFKNKGKAGVSDAMTPNY